MRGGCRVVIPSNDSEGQSLSDHFGRAPFFAVIDTDESGSISEKTTHPNIGEHHGGRGHAHANVLKYQPDVIIAHGMGPRGIMNFQSLNVAVMKANSNVVDEVDKAYYQKGLEELTEGCQHAHHE